MLLRYRAIWRSLGLRVQLAALDHLGITCTTSQDTFHALHMHAQADVVLALLRVNKPETLRGAEKLVGRRIVRCPPALVRLASGNIKSSPGALDPDYRRVKYIQPTEMRRDALPGTPLHAKLNRHCKPGVTVKSLLSRGLNRRDIRTAERKGWLELVA
jgi:hypothetical protein